MRRLALAVAVLLTAAGAAPAQGAVPRSAERFAEAAQRAREGFVRARPQIAAQFRAAEPRRCARTLAEDVPPERARERALNLYALALTHAAVGQAGLRIYERLVADLDAVPTRDPALRAGRDAWRTSVDQLRRLPAGGERACAALAAWAATGYAREAAPPPSLAAMREVVVHDLAEDPYYRALRRAERRLRRLGVSRRAAARFAGDDLVTAGVPAAYRDDFLTPDEAARASS